jgi:hypothetical protein
MPEYRAYIVGTDDRFIDAIHLVCRDESEATEKAKRLNRNVELWAGRRLVATFGHVREESSDCITHDGRMVSKPARQE